MGSTVYWRQPPDRDARNFETFVEFGGGRRSGKGFMAYSERSGPGVVVLHPQPASPDSVLDFARAVQADGFTVLVPEVDLDGDDAELARLGAAADFLVDNWHPRLGVVAFRQAATLAGRFAGERGCDALVLCEAGEMDSVSLEAPALHCTSDEVLPRTLEFFHYHLS